MATQYGYVEIYPSMWGGYWLEVWANGVCQFRQFFLQVEAAQEAYLALVV